MNILVAIRGSHLFTVESFTCVHVKNREHARHAFTRTDDDIGDEQSFQGGVKTLPDTNDSSPVNVLDRHADSRRTNQRYDREQQRDYERDVNAFDYTK